jgi:hypothetical protein
MTRPLVLAAALLLLPQAAAAQKMPPPTSYWTQPKSYVPESDRHRDWYTIAGERDGPSMFRRIRQPGVEYEPGERLTFDRYHTVDVMYHWLHRWAEQYPTILELYEVGRSFEGRPIYQVTVTNRQTGRHTDKPAAYFDGGRHAGEITPSESVLWLLQYLLEGYGRDPRITRMVDTKTIYIRPQHNPDGSNLYLHTAQRNRSSVRPLDQDGNGLMDENPPTDLTGDGVIRQMRWRVAAGEGTHVLDERDPSGRLMRRVEAGEQGDWRVEIEAIDHVGDGRYGSDGIGGLDLHRNLLENWRPMPGFDETGRGYTQLGAGQHPLSEPEQYAMVMWMLTHPHIAAVNHMDTTGPFHLRGPSTSATEERMYPEDIRLFEYFDSLGKSVSGYPGAGDVYNDFVGGTPLFGHGPDFGYFYYGAIWYGDELWNSMRFEDYNQDGELDDWDRLHWDDNFNQGRCFHPWTPFDHPQLGRVEIGGFHPKFCLQNPPAHLLEEWARRQALFNLELIDHLPRLEITGVETRAVAGAEDGATHEVTVRWRNAGGMPTALRQAQLVRIVREDEVRLVFPAELTTGDAPRVRFVGEPAILSGWTQAGEEKAETFRLTATGTGPVAGTVRLLSTRGGVAEVPVSITAR